MLTELKSDRVAQVLLGLVIIGGLAACGVVGWGLLPVAPVTPAQVAAGFRAAGLECENTRPLTKDDFGTAPYVSGDGIRFFLPSLGEDKGGRIVSVPDPDDRQALVSYYSDLGRDNARLFSWVFVKDNIVVQINGDLPEDQARKYEAVLIK